VKDILEKQRIKCDNVYTNEEGNAETILIEAVYRGKDYVKILNPVFVNKLTSYKGIFEGK
jgi:tRNA1(Val) A37 N6-methylase TrmN6